MAIILFDPWFNEIGPMLISCDIETGTSKCQNNIEITSELPSGAYGLYIPGTDCGGVIEYIEGVSGEVPTKKAWTWRGLLTQWIICPDSGNDYKTITNMELNNAIRSILSGVLGSLFVVPNIDTGITVSSFQFNLYATVLDGLSALCKSVGCKLYIHADKDDASEKVIVYAEAKPIVTLEGEYTEDSSLKLRFIQNNMGINHMICMGQGELQDRERVDLYLQADGSIGKTKYYAGFLERQYYYDDSAAQDLETLEKEGREYFLDIMSKNSLTINSSPESLEIGDVVKGQYRAEGITVESTISKKIYRITGDIVDVEYSISNEEE